MLATNKDILAVQSEVDDLRRALAEQRKFFVESVRDFCESFSTRFEELEESVEKLQNFASELNEWDDQTRQKFRALSKHLGVTLVRQLPDYEVQLVNKDVEDVTV